MADVATAPQPDQQVDLNTIPISPSDETSGESKEQGSTTAPSDGEIRTVFHDADNFNVKHPLMHTWTLWFTKPPSGKVCSSTPTDFSAFANRCRAITGMNSSRKSSRLTRSKSFGVSM